MKKRKKNMGILLILLLVLSGCGGKDSQNDADNAGLAQKEYGQEIDKDVEQKDSEKQMTEAESLKQESAETQTAEDSFGQENQETQKKENSEQENTEIQIGEDNSRKENEETQAEDTESSGQMDEQGELLYSERYMQFCESEWPGFEVAIANTNTEKPVLFIIRESAYDIDTGYTVTMCDVYYIIDNEVQMVGEVASEDESYRITVDAMGIYTVSEDTVCKYEIDEENGTVVLAEMVSEFLDEDGNLVCQKFEYGEEVEAEEDAFMNLIKDYARANGVEPGMYFTE